MKVLIETKTDLFNVTTVTIKYNGNYTNAEVLADDVNEYIKRKLLEIAADTVRKMHDQKSFFFRYSYYIADQALAFHTLGEYLNQDLTFDFIKLKVLTVLRDLIPAKSAQHYQLFASRYYWLMSLCYGANNDRSACELHKLYFQNKEDKILV